MIWDSIDGLDALENVLRAAGYPSVLAAVAAHAVFLHPDTVAQTQGRAVFPIVRDAQRRGVIGVCPAGTRVLFCDNTSPTQAFVWSAGVRFGRDVQYNHVWSRSQDPTSYTALWNIFVTPAFLAKTTDTHVDVRNAMRYRAWDLYGHLPSDEMVPTRPDGYAELAWAVHPPALANLEAVLSRRLASSPKSRPAVASREIGSVFGPAG